MPAPSRPQAVLALLCAAFAACGGSTNPSDRVPALGRYRYLGVVYGPDVPGGRARHDGTLTLTYATPDSIAGVWAVPGFAPVAVDGRWSGPARGDGPGRYALDAVGAAGSGLGRVQHLISTRASGIDCQAGHFLPKYPNSVYPSECGLALEP